MNVLITAMLPVFPGFYSRVRISSHESEKKKKKNSVLNNALHKEFCCYTHNLKTFEKLYNKIHHGNYLLSHWIKAKIYVKIHLIPLSEWKRSRSLMVIAHLHLTPRSVIRGYLLLYVSALCS
jgi:hypothetical protein